MPALVPALPPPDAREGLGAIEEAAARDLDRWGKADTVLGQLVLLLAWRLDHSERDGGSGIAALSKAFMLHWGELRDAFEREDEDSPLSQVRSRVRQRRVELVSDEPWDPEQDPA